MGAGWRALIQGIFHSEMFGAPTRGCCLFVALRRCPQRPSLRAPPALLLAPVDVLFSAEGKERSRMIVKNMIVITKPATSGAGAELSRGLPAVRNSERESAPRCRPATKAPPEPGRGPHASTLL